MKFEKSGALRSCRAAILVLALGVLSGCNGSDLDQFVEQKVRLKVVESAREANALTLAGDVEFTTTHHYTRYRTECDREICGYERYCEQVPRQVCHTREVCSNVPDSVCKTDPETKKQSCTTVTRRVCRPETICSPVYDTVCRSIPRYCDVNCREVPYPAQYDTTTKSPVNLTLHCADGAAIDPDQIKRLELGIKTNSDYRDAFDDVRKQPKGLRNLFKSLRKEDRSLLILEAKGLGLVGGQSFLSVPEGFRKGDALKMDVAVERIDTGKKGAVTGLGSEADVPELREHVSQ